MIEDKLLLSILNFLQKDFPNYRIIAYEKPKVKGDEQK